MTIVFSEIADTAKLAKNADNIIDAAKVADKATDIGKTVKKTNKAPNFASFPKTVHKGRQGKHIVGHNNYQKGRSIFNGTAEDAQRLIKKYSGTGQRINSSSERVDFKKIIGKFVDERTGKAYDTTIGTIRYSKDGAHIVPARPINWR